MGKKEHLMKDLIKFADDISVEYPLNKMILFGSQATGKVHRDSDVDLILVSKTFQKKRRLARSPPLYLRWTLDYPVDFLCYTPEEFERKKKQIGIVKQAVKEGIQIV